MDGRRSNRQKRIIRRKGLAITGMVLLALLVCAGAAALLSREVRYDALSAGTTLGSYSAEAGKELSERIDALYGEINARFGTDYSPRLIIRRRSYFFGIGAPKAGVDTDSAALARELVLGCDGRITEGQLVYIGGEPVACVADAEEAENAVSRAEDTAAAAITAELPEVSVSGMTQLETEELLCPADEVMTGDELYALLSAGLPVGISGGLNDGGENASKITSENAAESNSESYSYTAAAQAAAVDTTTLSDSESGSSDTTADADADTGTTEHDSTTADTHPLLTWARTTIGSADASISAAAEYYQPLVQLRRYRTLYASETAGYETEEPAVLSVLDMLDADASETSDGTETSNSNETTDNAEATDNTGTADTSDEANVSGTSDTSEISGASERVAKLTESPYYRSERARALLALELTRTETEYRSTDYDSIEEPRSDRPSGYTYPSRAGVCGIAAVTETVSYGSDGSITRSDESAEELVKPISEILLVGEGTGTEPGQPTGELLWPLETTDMYIGSLFREVREAFDARTGHHIGADLQTVEGDEVWAADGGTVILAEEHLSYGLLVEIDHGNGLVSLYGHLSDITVSVGDKVAPLDVVGHVGETGVATSPHLHFELRRDDVPINPFEYLPDIPVNYNGEKVRSRELDAEE